MSLVFAGLTPHPPLLIENIGKENLTKLKNTKEAMERLEEELYLTHPQVLFIISPHEGIHESAFVVNVHDKFTSNFEEFGDVVTSKFWTGAGEFGARIAHEGNNQHIPIRLVNEEKIRYGASIPLHYLTSHLPNIKIVPIGYSGLSTKDHMAFGELLKEIILMSGKRIAVIASGDMSHCMSKKSPMPYNPKGKEFDETLQTLLHTRNTLGISQIDTNILEEAHECCYKSLLVLLGVLKNVDYQFENYCYEHPFGVGYLTGNFRL